MIYLFHSFVDLVPNFVLVAENLTETFDVIAGPVAHRFAVSTERIAHQVVLALNADHHETVRMQIDVHVAAHRALAALEHGLHVSHHRIVVLPLVQVIAVESGDLVFPEELPFGQRMFLEHVMRFDDNHRGGSLETYTGL